MNRKVIVWFVIEPEIIFLSEENYPSKNITPKYEDKKLIGLNVEVEVDMSYPNAKAIEKARAEIIPLLERIRFLTGIYFEATVRRIKQISPQQLKAEGIADISCNVTVSNPSSMPTENEILGQDEDVTCQLRDFNKGINSDNVVERIKYFYLVLEREMEEIDPSYTIPVDLIGTRHAVSHYKLTTQRWEQWLISKIKTNSIDHNNPEHIEFLHDMEQNLQQAARDILNKKVPTTMIQF